ncbi:MAG: TPMT family class I SAM-dependent methyltransferase [Verrucomicrobiales bacterium]|nr:TPMT family class I SAM-dependent methyltransferase [Verrucomicrobiales bacterium]
MSFKVQSSKFKVQAEAIEILVGRPYFGGMSQMDWELRYQTHDMPWEKGGPSPGLVDFLAAHPSLPRGTACVPGCGTGHDVLAWAQAGFDASGYDIAPSAVRLSQERLRAAALSPQVECADFLNDPPPRTFDWVFEHTLFCAIDPTERDQYVRAVLRWLRTGGNYLAVNYLIPDKEGPPFGTTRAELQERFSPHFELLEEKVPRSYPNRTGLELLLWWRKRT